MKKQLLLLAILLSMFGTKVVAYDIEVKNADGVTIYYNYINDGTELEVTYNGKYSGSVVIPEEVTYMNRTRRVTSIGGSAFDNCSDLTSVTISNSVTKIGEWAFSNCSSLTSITIPNSVTSIGFCAFQSCRSLTSITIPNNVTNIEEGAFSGSSSLILIIVESGNNTYDSRDNCNAIIETNTNTLITGCRNTVIPNSVTSLGNDAFRGCNGLTSVTIPSSVTSIGDRAFFWCSSLTSVTIPNSVTTIGSRAFDGWDLPKIISKIENPFKIDGKSNSNLRTFSLNTFNNATLYVPVGTIDKYKSTEGWKDFIFIEEGDGGGDTPPEPKKCEKPTISYSNGKLTFNCPTEGAICQSTITDTDIASYTTNEVQLGVIYNISVYATKSGFENSEMATATLCWIDVDPKTEGITDGIVQIPSKTVLIQSNSGLLTIQGIDNGTNIAVYSVSGHLVGSTKANGNQVSLATNLKKGDIAIIKIGEKSVKVVIQ